MKKILALLFLAVSVQAQDSSQVTPTGVNDRGPWGGASLMVNATRCAEYHRVMKDLGTPLKVTRLMFEAVAGVPYVPRDSTATHTMTQERLNLSFKIEPGVSSPSNTFLAKMYRAVARSQYALGEVGESLFALRNVHADLAAGYLVGNATKRANIQTAIESILRKPEPFEL